MSTLELETERLLLRPHRPDDFDDSARLWADPKVVEFISGEPNSREQSWARLLRNIGHWQALGYGYWAVFDRATGAFLGEVGFAEFQRETEPPVPDVPEAGWVLMPEAHGRGIATEAVTRVHQWADAERGWPETFCILEVEHVASLRVAQKLGYEIQGRAQYRGSAIWILRRSKA